MRTLRVLLILNLLCFGARGQDVVFLKNGETSTGRVTAIQTLFLVLEVELAADQPKATLSLPLVDVDHVDFGETEAMEEYLAEATRGRLLQIEKLWKQRETLLRLPSSTAGALALKMADLLMKSRLESDFRLALKLYSRIERDDWNGERKARAREGRLRALVALGRAAEAVAEAKRMALYSEDPQVLIEAKYVLAKASLDSLRQLLEDNPRWEEDLQVRPERERLYGETLDLFLYPYLFHGSHSKEAARGLWGAVETFRVAGDTAAALARARDLAALYPDTGYASEAAAFLKVNEW